MCTKDLKDIDALIESYLYFLYKGINFFIFIHTMHLEQDKKLNDTKPLNNIISRMNNHNALILSFDRGML